MENSQKPDESKKKVTVEISGYLPQDPQLKNHKPKEGESEGKQSYTFAVAQNTKEGPNYVNIRVSEKFFDSVKGLKAGDRVDVTGYPRSYEYKDGEGSKQSYNYIQAGTDIVLVKDQKRVLSGNIGSEITWKETENGKRAEFSIAVQGPIKDEKPIWYNISAGSRFMDEGNMPGKGDLVEVTGYVQAKTGNLEKKGQEYKFGGNVKLSEPVAIRAKKGEKVEQKAEQSKGQKI
jgi:single-stranded DNA-binding protein